MFVGRVAEAQRLLDALGQGRPAVVVGPPGMGKSALVAATARRAAHQVSAARGMATLAAVPFLLFRSQVEIDGDDGPDEVAGRVRSRFQGVLVLDDLQWADPASLEVVERIAGRVPILATVRSGEPRSGQVLDRLARVGFERLDLPGLSDEESWELARSVNPGLDEARLEEVVSAAKGSPLLLTELGGTGSGSPTLTAALLDRLDHLADGARTAMYRLSVLGRPATAEELGPAAGELASAGLAHERNGRLEVHHDLLAELVVEQLGERADDVRRELAGLVGDFEASLLLTAAGERAEARLRAFEAAAAATTPRDRVEALLTAVANAPEGELDLDLRVEVTQLLNEFGRPQEALELAALDRTDRPGVDPQHRGSLIAVAAYSYWLLGQTKRFAKLMEEALGHLRGSRSGAEVRVLAGSTIYATWVDLDGRSALERAQEALRLADEIGEARAFARVRLAAVMSTAGIDGWVELYEEAIEIADATGDTRSANEAGTSLVLALWTSGRAAEARAVCDRMMGITPRDHQPVQWLVHASVAAILDLLLGVRPETIVERWKPILDTAPPYRTRPFLEAAVTVALADLGRDRDARDATEGMVERSGTSEQWRAVALWVVAEVAWSARRTQALAAAVDRIDELGVRHYPPAVMARLLASHAAVLDGSEPVGDEPLALLPAWAATPVEWRALVAEHEGRWSDAVTSYEEAAQLYAGRDERSRLRCELAAARAERSRGGDPVPRLVAVETEAEERGYLPLLHQVRQLLRRCGVKRNAPSGRRQGGLTAREHEVLELVGAGRTSAQIAVELGISRATVDDLVRSAMRRLGVSNRRAAVAWLKANEEG